MTIRKAVSDDLDGVAAVYEEIHDMEEAGTVTTGWLRGVYPTKATAEAALRRGDLFVMEEDGRIIGSALINQIEVDRYRGAPWKYGGEVCVLHTLTISPKSQHKGLGRQFVEYYEQYALGRGWYELRLDTNERNARARQLYAKMGYQEIAVVPAVFNGIPDVNLVLLEKNIKG